ncbi:hypothetical protein [Streptomyces endophytica]|uniref:DUF4232 domain-containing protein n=1 Tax=Streptomyces endophytica TaxID=2991496 RepID=A0ABY6P9Y5_9ACTN|nr:hypothetical protein [Streptomyces endophytica]UZJ30290.1 hypothetical protein OJ254_07665 [Streptomyces endophytica]
MLHVVNLADGSPDRPANAASSQRAHDADGGTHGEGTEQAGPRPTDQGGARPGGGQPAGKGKAAEKNGAGHGAGAGTPAPDETMDVTSPVCGRDQLGQGTSKVGQADADGRVYGAFRVVNTSTTPCSVQGGGTVVLASAQGSTNPDHIHVVDHTSGDEATGLPDPATTPDQLVLKPGEAYEVKFAWIPQAGGGPTGCANPGPSPTPDPRRTRGSPRTRGPRRAPTAARRAATTVPAVAEPRPEGSFSAIRRRPASPPPPTPRSPTPAPERFTARRRWRPSRARRDSARGR